MLFPLADSALYKVKQNGKKVERAPLDQIHIPDPVKAEIDRLNKEVKELSNLVKSLGE